MQTLRPEEVKCYFEAYSYVRDKAKKFRGTPTEDSYIIIEISTNELYELVFWDYLESGYVEGTEIYKKIERRALNRLKKELPEIPEYVGRRFDIRIMDINFPQLDEYDNKMIEGFFAWLIKAAWTPGSKSSVAGINHAYLDEFVREYNDEYDGNLKAFVDKKYEKFIKNH